MTDLQQRLAEALAEKFTRATPRYDRKTDTLRIDKPEPADRVDSAMSVSFIAGDGHPSFRMVTCNEAAQVCAEVVDADVKRSAQAARECARNTDAAAEMIRTALLTARDHGPAEGIRVLTKMASNVDGLLDGLDLPAANPSAPAGSYVEHDDGACTRCGDTEGDIWPISGQRGYFCRHCVIQLTGRDPEG